MTGAASSVAPDEATCDWISVVHVPAPLPASESVTETVLLFAPPPATRYPNDRDWGSVKSSGRSAEPTRTRPAPSTITEASCVPAVSAKEGPAVDISADFICAGVQLG